MLSKEASSTIFWVFGMTRPGIEPRSPGPLANTLTTIPVVCMKHLKRVRDHLFHSVKWFQAFLSTNNNSIKYQPFINTQLNRFKFSKHEWFYFVLIISFHRVKPFQIFLRKTSNLFKHRLFVCILLNISIWSLHRTVLSKNNLVLCSTGGNDNKRSTLHSIHEFCKISWLV